MGDTVPCQTVGAGECRELLAGQSQGHRTIAPFDRERPGGGRLVGVAGSDEPQVRDRSQGGVVLDRLVGRTVLAQSDRVVRPDVDEMEPGQGRQPDAAAHVVAEGQEGRAVRDEPRVIGDAVGDTAHGVLADPEAQVAAGVLEREVPGVPDVGQVRLGQVGGAAEELGQAHGEGVDRILAGVPGGDLGAGLVDVEVRVPVVGQAPRDPSPELAAGVRVRRLVASQRRAPVLDQVLADRGPPTGSGRGPRPGRRTSGPGPSRRPPWSGGPRRVRAVSRAPSGCRACSGCRSRCASAPR